jgi:hypothetical protein
VSGWTPGSGFLYRRDDRPDAVPGSRGGHCGGGVTQGFTGARGSRQIWLNTAKWPVSSDFEVPVFPSSGPLQEMRPVTFLTVLSLVAASAVTVIAQAATVDRSRLQSLPGSDRRCVP